jgi:hypothetical protein
MSCILQSSIFLKMGVQKFEKSHIYIWMGYWLMLSYTNAIYKHTHHGEYINIYMMFKWC